MMNNKAVDTFFSFDEPEKLIFHGIEKECLRVNKAGELSEKKHPEGLGSKLTNPYITTDYSENLLEFITPPFNDSEKLMNFLTGLHIFTEKNLEDEYLWPNSMPAIIHDEKMIKVADYGDVNIGKLKTLYRVGLGHRYGKSMQTIAGIHFNFSIADLYWDKLKKEDDSLTKNKMYMGLIRNFRRYSYLLKFLFGTASSVHKSFLDNKVHSLKLIGNETYELENGLSLRVGPLGYTSNSQENIQLCFNSVENYVETLERARLESYSDYEKIGLYDSEDNRKQLNTNILQIDNEYYSNIRPKNIAKSKESALQALHKRGIEYIEVRLTDLNPLEPVGISLDQVYFYKVFLLWCLFRPSPEITAMECSSLKEKFLKVVLEGDNLNLYNEELNSIFDELKLLASRLGSKYLGATNYFYQFINNPQNRSSQLWKKRVQDKGFIKANLEIAEKRVYDYALSDQFEKELKLEAQKSLLEQAKLERMDQLEFEEFLVKYFEEIKI